MFHQQCFYLCIFPVKNRSKLFNISSHRITEKATTPTTKICCTLIKKRDEKTLVEVTLKKILIFSKIAYD